MKRDVLFAIAATVGTALVVALILLALTSEGAL